MSLQVGGGGGKGTWRKEERRGRWVRGEERGQRVARHTVGGVQACNCGVCLPVDLLYIMYAHTRVSVRSDRACGHDYIIYRHTQWQTSSYFFFLILCRSYLEVVLMVERFTGFLISLFLVFL